MKAWAWWPPSAADGETEKPSAIEALASFRSIVLDFSASPLPGGAGQPGPSAHGKLTAYQWNFPMAPYAPHGESPDQRAETDPPTDPGLTPRCA